MKPCTLRESTKPKLSSSCGGDTTVSARVTGRGSGGLKIVDFQLQLAFVTAQVPLLLLSYQGKRLALHAGWWLLDIALCMVMTEALKAVSV